MCIHMCIYIYKYPYVYISVMSSVRMSQVTQVLEACHKYEIPVWGGYG